MIRFSWRAVIFCPAIADGLFLFFSQWENLMRDIDMKCDDNYYRLSLTWPLQPSGLIRDKASWVQVCDMPRYTDLGFECARESIRMGSSLVIKTVDLDFHINARKQFIQRLECGDWKSCFDGPDSASQVKYINCQIRSTSNPDGKTFSISQDFAISLALGRYSELCLNQLDIAIAGRDRSAAINHFVPAVGDRIEVEVPTSTKVIVFDYYDFYSLQLMRDGRVQHCELVSS